MIKEDIIECSSYFKIPGMVIQGNFKGSTYWETPPDCSVVACTTDDISEFFRRHGNNGKHYVVVSSCSDFGVALSAEHGWLWDARRRLEYAAWKYPYDVDKQYSFYPAAFLGNKVNVRDKYYVRSQLGAYYSFPSIPDNIVHWYQTNSYLFEERVTPIPFGIPEGNRSLLWEVIQENHKKRFDIYVNFGMTNPIDREWVRNDIINKEMFQGRDVTINDGLSTYDFYRCLAQHRHAVCPPGVGWDQYKIYESVYLGVRPIVDPAHFYQDTIGWDNYDYYYDCHAYQPFHIPNTLKLSYWTKKFFSHFGGA